MKLLKTLLFLLNVVAILLASVLYVHAIGFDAEAVYESVLVVYSGSSLGSGFAIGENCIITNAHVIDNKRNITVETYGGKQYKAIVLGINNYEDIAVLVVNGVKFPYLKVADSSKMKIGDDIYAIGAPKGMTYTLTKGSVSAKEREISNQTYIQIDAAINEGNSGGPLLNDNGQVLGVNTLKMTDSEGLGLAIPITRVCAYLKSIGVQLNADGNVVQDVDTSETPPSDDESSSQSDASQDESAPPINNEQPAPNTPTQAQCETSAITYVAIFVAAVSLIGNIVLASLLKKQKKLTSTLRYNSNTIPDFDIDILE